MFRTAITGEWKPRQCVELSPSVYGELATNSSQKVAFHLMKLCPPFIPGSIIHDNACGTGVVTAEIMNNLPISTKSGANILIHATDLSPSMVEACATKIRENGWQDVATTSLMAMQDLSFPPETFTHSITNFAIFSLSDADATQAARQIFQTLRLGGTAILTTWGEVAHRPILEDLHRSTRVATKPLPTLEAIRWEDISHLNDVLENAGFEKSKIRLEQLEIEVEIGDLKRWSQVLWTIMGRPESGWVKRDEEVWGEVTMAIEERMERSRGFRRNATGDARVRAVVNIAIATK